MTLKDQPKKLAIIGAGAIGCEFGDFYNAMGTEVTIVEMLDHLLPIEDEDCSILLERSFAKRGIKFFTKTKTESVDTSGNGVKLKLTTPKGEETVEADLCLLAVGVTGNVEGLFGPDAPVELFKNHIKVEPNEYKTNIEGIYAAGDVIGPPWLAHVAHHEAVYAVEKIFGVSDHDINYKMIPGCTYTHPQVREHRFDRKESARARLGDQDRQVSFQRQRSRASGGRYGRIYEADLRCEIWLAPRRAYDRRERDRIARRTGDRAEARSNRGRDHRSDAPAPDHERSRHGSGRRRVRTGDSSVITEMKYRDVIQQLKDDGWQHVRTTGSHLHFRHLKKPGLVTVPAGGKLNRDIAPGTLRSILRQAGLQ